MERIVCPNCGAEYAPQEIFIMTNFNNNNIVKDEHGKILDDLIYDDDESYKCDYCNTTFFSKMKIDFDVYTSKLEKHTTRLHKPTLFLEEE